MKSVDFYLYLRLAHPIIAINHVKRNAMTQHTGFTPPAATRFAVVLTITQFVHAVSFLPAIPLVTGDFPSSDIQS